MYTKPNIVISKCIEHGHCRYDGSMIGSQFVKEMEPYVNFMPLCPEMGIGLPSPRESLRLADKGQGIRLLSYKLGTDRTDEMKEYAESAVKNMKKFNPGGSNCRLDFSF